MKIEIQNICATERAVIDVDGTALIVGKNGAGKTNICDAIGYTASGQIKNLNKAELAEFVRTGGGESFVKIIAEEGTVRGAFPSGDFKKSGGWGIEASIYAAGVKSLADMSVKERSKEIASIMKAEPTNDEWVKALTEAGISAPVASTVANQIGKSGPDKSHDHYVENGRTMKRQFEEVTHIGWGSKQGGSWQPKNWSASEDTVETMQKALDAEKKTLEGSIRVDAVKQDDIQKLKAEAATLGQAQAEAAAAAKEEKDAQTNYKHYADAYQKAPRLPADEKTTPCPHCEAAVVIRGNTLSKPSEKLSSEEMEEIGSYLDVQKSRMDEWSDKLKIASSAAMRTQLAVSNAKKAQVRLDELEAKAAEPRPEVDIDESRARIAELEAQIAGTIAKKKADKLHQDILDNQIIIDVLKPTGLRQVKLSEKFEDLNARLEEICQTAGWKTVRVSEDTTITYGGNRYEGRGTSTGQKFIVRCALQFAFAQIQGCKLIVIDAADVMDADGRGGLMTVLKTYGINAVISMTYSDRADAPNVAEWKFGRTYWLEGSGAQLIEKVAA